MKRALISVTDKTGLGGFAHSLLTLGFELISTGGSARYLRDHNIAVTDVSEITGFPEIMDGRVKTLHPKIHAGLLMDRQNDVHLADAREHGISGIELVVVNLYQFADNAVKNKLGLDEAIEFIDIGGPAMLRAAAKNFAHVLVVSEPDDYQRVAQALKENSVTHELRRQLAAKVFNLTGSYDQMIARFLNESADQSNDASAPLPNELVTLKPLRYGENPHQKAMLLRPITPSGGGWPAANQLQGKELSYNNYLDLDAAMRVVLDLDVPGVAIIKHNTPCGVAASSSLPLHDIYQQALSCDSEAAFGGIIASNQIIDGATAAAMKELFLECIVAPDFDTAAREIFSGKKNLRLVTLDFPAFKTALGDTYELRSIAGSYLAQSTDNIALGSDSWEHVTQTKPSQAQLQDLTLALTVVKHVKSNAIVLALNGQALAIAGGQVSRIEAARQAFVKAAKSRLGARGAVLASDAFFPFSDCVTLAAEHGVAAIVQPGGSVRDEDSIAACNEHGIAMSFCHHRHFRH